MNYAEAVAGAVNDVGRAAAAKSACPGASSEDARHLLLASMCTQTERKGGNDCKFLQLANVLDLLDNLSACASAGLRVCVCLSVRVFACVCVCARAANCISLWG